MNDEIKLDYHAFEIIHCENHHFEGLLLESVSIISNVSFMCSMSWVGELHKLPPLLLHLGRFHF